MDTAPLFEAAGLQARVLQAGEVPQLQALFDANPLYFETVSGRPAAPDEAQREFDERPPPHLSWRSQWLLGVWRASDRSLQGVIIATGDLCAEGVWHTALFLLATALHGSGAAAALHAAQIGWMQAQGARWLRLGVVLGNTRAERFWARQGYRPVRRREGIPAGDRLNTVQLMVRPLGDATLADYLARVPRDDPASTLP